MVELPLAYFVTRESEQSKSLTVTALLPLRLCLGSDGTANRRQVCERCWSTSWKTRCCRSSREGSCLLPSLLKPRFVECELDSYHGSRFESVLGQCTECEGSECGTPDSKTCHPLRRYFLSRDRDPRRSVTSVHSQSSECCHCSLSACYK